MPPQIIIPAVFVLIVIISWFINTYNKFIKYKNRIEESWSGIDVALKRRFNLIPNLVNSIGEYGKHEASIIEKISDNHAKLSSGFSDRVKEESQISRSLGGILALAEAYPELKASQNFLDLQNNLDEIEEDIQKARNRYNSYVGRFNTLVESFPSKFIAHKYGFIKQKYFSLELATQRELPMVDFSSSEFSSQKENPSQTSKQ